MTAIDTVIVAYRSEDVIEDAVRRGHELGGTVVVVDHGDGVSARRATDLGATAFEDPSNPGFGAGQNRGVARTTSPYVLLCNPDAKVVVDAIAAGVALLDDRPEVGAVQGAVVNQRTGKPERSAGVEVGPVHLVGRAIGARRLLGRRLVQTVAGRSRTLRDHVVRVPEAAAEVESLAATVLLVRRSAFDAVGGFDESYFLYGEDLDLCRRLRRSGWKLVALPDRWATHASGASAETSWSRELTWWRGTMQFGARWWGRGSWLVARAAAAVMWARLALRNRPGARDAFRALVVEPGAARRRRRTPAPNAGAVSAVL